MPNTPPAPISSTNFYARASCARAGAILTVPLRDRYVGPALSLGLECWLGAYERTVIDAGHWVVLREPERIAASIERFVERHRADQGGPAAETVNVRAAGA